MNLALGTANQQYKFRVLNSSGGGVTGRSHANFTISYRRTLVGKPIAASATTPTLAGTHTNDNDTHIDNYITDLGGGLYGYDLPDAVALSGADGVEFDVSSDQSGDNVVFEDVVSGKQLQRRGLSALIDYARSGNSMASTRLDRLGRSLKKLQETAENLKTQDNGLISLEKRIDTTSAAGALIFYVYGAIAHCVRRLVSERPKIGIEAARAQGRQPGRPPVEAEIIVDLQDLVQVGTTA
ncbi:MAG: recombinase family protein [Pseudomonadota bacterium]